MRSQEVTPLAVGILVVTIMFGWSYLRLRHSPPSTRPAVNASGADLVVPRARVPAVDGELDDDGWAASLRSGAFLREDGQSARPHSEARLLWGDGQLYLGLYAADEDVQARIAEADGPLWLSDAFQISLRTGGQAFRIDVSPRGTLTDARVRDGGALDFGWSSGARVASDVDGTIGDSRDRDEEWVIEIAIPLESLGMRGRAGERMDLTVRRCDELREGGRACGSWGTEETPLRLVLGAEATLHGTSVASSP